VSGDECLPVVLRDGSRAVLRPAARSDIGTLTALFGGPPDADQLWVVEDIAERLVIGAGGYQRDGGEVAHSRFAVSPEHLGRGIGTLLLEQALDAAAAEGIGTLTALVPEGGPAHEVLRACGTSITEQIEDGRVHVTLLTQDEDAGFGPRDERERARTAASLVPLFRPRSIAVIGASRSPTGIGRQVFDRLLRDGFEGPVYPVNPAANFVSSVRAYPSISDVPETVDLAVIAVPAPAVHAAVEECADAGVPAVMVLSAGFGETGPEGQRQEDELLRLVRRHGMRMVGPNCLGVLNTDPGVRMNATFGRPLPSPGRIGMSSQSGAMGLVIVDYARQLHLGLSTFVSVGNKADVSGNDLLEYWERDPATDVIVLYLESFGNPTRFARIARRVSRQKPILAVKSGRSAAGARAAQSHTAALASSDAAVDALFRQTGVIRLDTLEELFDTAAALSHQPLPAGNRVAIVTNAGGPGILCADACQGAGLELPELSESTIEVLRAVLPPAAAVHNPVDMIAAATPDQYEVAIEWILQDPSVDALIVLNVSIGGRRAEAFADAIRNGAEVARGASDVRKPVLTCFMSPDSAAHPVEAAGAVVPTYRFPEEPARALARMWQYRSWRDRVPGRVPRLDRIDAAAARGVVAARTADSRWLSPDKVAQLLDAAGIPLPAYRMAVDVESAVAAATELGPGPVAVKVVARDILHKTDVGGVALELRDGEAVRAACERMLRDIPGVESFLVQEMVPEGIEVILGVADDPTFGKLIAFGLGGTAVEVLQDVSFGIPPLTDADATELVRSIRGFPLLSGFRGAKPADIDALEELLLRLSWLTRAVPEIAEIDLNPVRVFPAGRGVSVVDARIAVER
jgi:acetate---CoA ligase (ADP-forming)